MGRNLRSNCKRNDIEARKAAGHGGEESIATVARLANPGLPPLRDLRLFTLLV